MKMVSSAKLRKAQRIIENFYPYEQKMNALLNNFLSAQEGDIDSVFADEREIERVAIVVLHPIQVCVEVLTIMLRSD